MKHTPFVTNLNFDQIEERLASFDNFDVKERSRDELTASVGSEARYRIVGSWVTQDYQAPIVIDAAANADGTTTVQLSRRQPLLFHTPKDDRFFEEGYAKIQAALEA